MKRTTIEGLPSPAVRTPNQGEAASPAMQLDLERSVRSWPRLAAGVAAGVFLLLVVFGLTRTKMYEAESLTYIEPMASKVLSDGTSGIYDPSRYDSYIQQQMQTALRPDILEAALAKLPPHTWQRPGESMQSAVARLQSSLKVQRVLTSYQLSIDLTDANPQVAAAVVNAVTNAYLEEGRKDEHAVIDQRLKLLNDERARIQQQLGEDRVEQAQLGRELGFASPTGAAMSQYDAQIAGVETQVAGAREARDIAAAQLAAAQGPGMQALAEEQLLTDPGLNSMRQTVSARKAVLSTQMAGMTPSNPIYKQDEAEIADLDRSLDAMTSQARGKAERRLADKMRSDLARTADIEGRLSAQLRQQTATATNAGPKLQWASELTGELERLTARYTVVDDAIRSLELESNGPGSAHLSVAATVPGIPEPNKRKMILLLALPLALFAGLAAAVLARRMDPKVWAGTDVQRVLGFQPIGVMPARGEVSARVMEEYTLRLAAGLGSALRVSSAQSFVFTAASSTVEISGFVRAMERVLASLGFKALVMDAAAVLQAAGRTNGGTRPSGLMRAIDGARLGYAAEEMERLKASYDLLLIDAPPLLHSAETEYLVRCADATILVAESGVTVKSELFQSAVLLQQLNVVGVGAVLQELHLKDADPAFRAAVAAVERIQRGRSGTVAEEREPPAAKLADTPRAERVYAGEKREVAAKVVPAVVEVAEAEPLREPEAEVAATPLPVTPVAGEQQTRDQAETASGESDDVRGWRELFKKTPEVQETLVETPVVSPPVFAESTDAPVLYFEDRKRPRPVVAEQPAQPVVEVAAEPEPPAPVVEMPPVEAVDEATVASLAENESLERTVVSAGVERHKEPVPDRWGGWAAEPAAVAQQEIAQVEDRPAVSEWDWAGNAKEAPVVEENVASAEEPALVEEEPVAEVVAVAAVSDAIAAIPEEEPPVPEVVMEEALQAVEMEPESVDTVAPSVEPVAVAPAESEPVRTPAAPRMEWFTLKFKGTTERVLRIVPGDEDYVAEPAAEPEATAETAAASPVAREEVPAETAVGAAAEEAEREFGAVDEAVVEVIDGAVVEAPVEMPVEAVEVAGAEELPQGASAAESAEEQELAVMEEAPQAVSDAVVEPVAEAEQPESIEVERPEVADEPAMEFVDLESEGAVFAVPEDLMERVDDHLDPSSLEIEAVSGTESAADTAAEEMVLRPAEVPVMVMEMEPPAVRRDKRGWVVTDATPEGDVESAWVPTRLPRGEEALKRIEELAPARLVDELRSRSAQARTPEQWTRRSVGAPVEERLEPRGAARRWEMLSRFDTKVEPASETAEVSEEDRARA